METTADLLSVELPAPPPLPAPSEGYVVLARRYRPQTFDEIVGQEHIQTALRGAIASGQVAHAFLFSGPRGTGKTSTARILAKALNCQNSGPRPDPCGKCSSCRSITAGSSLDVIEIDAASNTGVDNIRDLRSGVVLAPFSRFKVYIVDEVHMLSTQAFNALLKTLEEPPPQVVFVLATTELQKVPETIVSRCQSFAFRRFTTTEIAHQLDRILGIELKRRSLTVTLDERQKIVDLLARNAEGGMRDAQVALDQVLVLSRDRIEFDTVLRFLGCVQITMLDDFIRALRERCTEDLLLLIDALVSGGQDLERFAKALAEHLRDLLIIRAAPGKPELVNVSPDRYEMLREIAESLPMVFLLNCSSMFVRLLEEMKSSAQVRFLLEFAVIRLTRIDPVDDINRILTRLQDLERAISTGGKLPLGPGSSGDAMATGSSKCETTQVAPQRGIRPGANVGQSVPPSGGHVQSVQVREPDESIENLEAEPGIANEPVPATPPPDLSAEGFLQQLRERTVDLNHYLHITLLDVGIAALNDTTFVLTVNPSERFVFDHLNRSQNQEILRRVAREITGKDLAMRLQFSHVVQASVRAPVAPEVAPAFRPNLPPQSAEEPHDFALRGSPVEEPGKLVGMAEETVVNTDDVMLRFARPLQGEKLKKFMEKHADVKDVFLKVKEAFGIDESQFTFRLKAL